MTASVGAADPARPFPQATYTDPPANGILRPKGMTQAAMNDAVRGYYAYWKKAYLKPSKRVPGDYKIDFDGTGETVSEAIGYGMLITVTMAGSDKGAKDYFDGLNRFRKCYPSSINPAFMCWRIPADERNVKDDCATDGDLDMALALLMAHEQWGDASYLTQATKLIQNIATTLVRPDGSLRLGDWDTEAADPPKTRPSDFMPTHFRVFREVTGDPLWDKVEERCYSILDELQANSAPRTGLVPDFAVEAGGKWRAVKGKVLENKHDGDFSYNACRVPWRIGWAASALGDPRARKFLERLMVWVASSTDGPEHFKPGYRLDGSGLGKNYASACFISPTGVASMVTGNQEWLNRTFADAVKRKEGYFEDSVNLLCLLVMSGNAWLPLHG